MRLIIVSATLAINLTYCFLSEKVASFSDSGKEAFDVTIPMGSLGIYTQGAHGWVRGVGARMYTIFLISG
jgi:hypothetical protein